MIWLNKEPWPQFNYQKNVDSIYLALNLRFADDKDSHKGKMKNRYVAGVKLEIGCQLFLIHH